MKIIKSQYEIIEKLGEGGIGVTYKAKDIQSDQLIAIKIISFRQITEWKTLDLFEREVRVLKQLDHPAIPKYFDSFEIDTEEDRLFCIVQTLAPGKNLVQWIQEGWKPTETEIQAIALQLLEVLIYLQQLTPAIIHRDIKPQNILRDENGQIYLVDFGAVQDTYRQTITGGSTVIGTFGYMAPEQFRGQATLATDLFGLGTTLVYLLTGKDPIDLPQTEALKLNLPPEITISASFRYWLEHLIEPAVEDRCTSAADAMLYFQGKEQPVNTAYQSVLRPKKTAINLTKTQSYLRIHFSPQNFSHPEALIALITSLFSLIYGIFIIYCLVTFGIPPTINLPFVFSFFAFTGLILVAGNRSIQILTKPVVLIANEEFIYLRGVLKPFQFHQECNLNLKYIDEVFLKKMSSKKSACIIKTIENDKFYLGTYLSLSENRWLSQEIQDFIQTAQSNIIAESHTQLIALKDKNSIAIDVFLRKGVLYYANRDVKNARKIFEAALLIDPDCAELHNNLGVIQAESKEYLKAIKSFASALNFAPGYWAARVNLAKAYELKGDLNESVRVYLDPCLTDQKSGLEEYTLLINNENKLTLAESVKYLQVENPVNSESLKTKNDYAYFLQLQGNSDAAFYAYQDAVKLANSRCFDIQLPAKKLNNLEQISIIYANMGWILALAGKIDKALTYLKKSNALNIRIKSSNTQMVKAFIAYLSN